jgi:TetR/AcrR family transcriptional regulator
MSHTASPPLTPDPAARERLLRAAIRLFTQKGYAATSVREIVEEAGVTKPVLYYHFKSKEGMYLTALRDGMEEYQELMASFSPTDEPADLQLRRACLSVYDLFIRYMDLMRLFHSVFYGPQQGAPHFDYHAVHNLLVETLRRLVRLGMDRGEFKDGDERAMTLAVLGAFNIATENDMIHPECPVGREGLDRTLDIIFRGLKTTANS